MFRPRRRPVLRLAVTIGVSTLLCFAAGTVIWLRRNVVPPGCTDPATLALVRQSLTERFKLPASVTIDDIETHAGGYLAGVDQPGMGHHRGGERFGFGFSR